LSGIFWLAHASWQERGVPLGHEGGRSCPRESDTANNLMWPLARVLELVPGNDGVVQLKAASGEYLQPVQKLYPLKVCEDKKIQMTPNDEPCNVHLSRAVEDPVASKASPQILTRSGRLVKATKPYDMRGMLRMFFILTVGG